MTQKKVTKEEILLGKQDWIEKITQRFPSFHHKLSVKNEGVTIISYGSYQTLITNKLFLDGIHFDLTYFPLKHLGYKFISVTISDILAMNILPTHLSIKIAVSNRFSHTQIEELIEGMRYCCEQYKIDLTQLDIDSSYQGLVASISLFGIAKKDQIVQIKGATENDLICVTGDLGAAYAGLLLLEREKKVFEVNPNSQPDFTGFEYLIERQLKPEARVKTIEKLKENKITPTSMTSINNGLASAILHICRQSKVGCTIIEEKIPIDILTFRTLQNLNIVATTIALNGGDDNELLFTIRQTDYEKLKNIEEISVVGYITDKNSGYHLITNDDKQIPLTAQEFSPMSF